LLFALSVHADVPVHAKLVGQRVVSSFPGRPILVCQYLGPEAKYEVVASGESCAPFRALSLDEPTVPALAKASTP
jgi:hypothetical protein